MKTTIRKVRAKKPVGVATAHTSASAKWAAKKSTFGLGVVHYFVHGRSGKAAIKTFTPSRMIDVVRTGLPIKELDELQEKLNVPMEKLASKLGISKATLHRRKREGRLGPEESDRVLRFARLLGKAVEVFESEQNARAWLSSPQVGLGGEVPLDYAETELGAREVEDLLGRIEYGVYS
jgi:putative toxin-antitoxin system antitoxin component (TIGR02293 family)